MKTLFVTSLTLFTLAGNLDAQLPGVTPDVTVSGSVMIDGQPAGDVLVGLREGAQVRTDAKGQYSIKVSKGYSGLLFASSPGVTFTPSARDLSNVSFSINGLDFAGKRSPAPPTSVKVRGVVRRATGDAAPAVTISFSNGGPTVVTGSDGSYEGQLAIGYTGIGTPRGDGQFAPISRNYASVQTDQISQDYVFTASPLPPPSIKVGGVVRRSTGGPAAGVSISFSNGGPTVTTGADGGYEGQLVIGYTGIATPRSDGQFAPASRNYANLQTDQTAQDYVLASSQLPPAAIKLSGMVRLASGGAAAGVSISFSNGGPTAITGANGAYSGQLPMNYSGVATPRGDGQFTPASRNYVNLQSDQIGQDYTFESSLSLPRSVRISGKIRNWNREPVGGVLLTTTTGTGGQSDASGSYEISVDSSFVGTITPIKEGYDFLPSSRAYTLPSFDLPWEDFVAIEKSESITTLRISGFVRRISGDPISGAILSIGNDAKALSDSTGNYLLPVPVGFTGSVTASHASFSFSTGVRAYENLQGDQLGQDFTGTAKSIPMTITGPACPLPAATVAVPFAATFELSGALGYVDWNLAAGDVLPGLTLGRATGELRGAPLRSGRFDFVVEATTTSAQSARKICALTVNPAPDEVSAECTRPIKYPSPNTEAFLDQLVTSTGKTDSVCSLPPPMSTVHSSDSTVYASFVAASLRAGDVVSVEWFSPGHHLYRETSFVPVKENGNFCFRASIPLAGSSAARQPGPWRVRVLVNGSSIGVAQFVVAQINPKAAGMPVIEKLTSAREARNDNCIAPEAVSAFVGVIGEQKTWMAFQANSRGTVRFDYLAPNGKTYRSFVSETLNSSGQCMTATINLAQVDRANVYGQWTVAISFNGTALASTSFTVAPALLQDAVTTRGAGEELSSCVAPSANNGFTFRDDRAQVWFQLNDIRAGGKAYVEWLDPAGTVLSRDVWEPTASDGDWCFSTDFPIRTSITQRPAGIWKVRIGWDAYPVAVLPFFVGPIEVDQFAMSDRATGCGVPPYVDGFGPGDDQAVAWVRVAGAIKGDSMRVDWLMPDGARKNGKSVNVSGTGLAYTMGALPITRSTTLGRWNAQIHWNEKLLLSVPFTVGAGAENRIQSSDPQGMPRNPGELRDSLTGGPACSDCPPNHIQRQPFTILGDVEAGEDMNENSRALEVVRSEFKMPAQAARRSRERNE